MKSIALHNLGCKVNGYEMDVMQQILHKKGYKIVPFDEKADIYIINTCTVTNIADQKSRQMLHRAKKKSGCGRGSRRVLCADRRGENCGRYGN